MLYFLALYAVANIIGEYLVYLPKFGGIIGGIYDKLLLGNIAAILDIMCLATAFFTIGMQ